VLSIAKVDLKLLLRARVKAEVGLVSEVVCVELHFDEARLRDERLGLLYLAAKHSWVSAVAHFSLRVAVHDLPTDKTRHQSNRHVKHTFLFSKGEKYSDIFIERKTAGTKKINS